MGFADITGARVNGPHFSWFFALMLAGVLAACSGGGPLGTPEGSPGGPASIPQTTAADSASLDVALTSSANLVVSLVKPSAIEQTAVSQVVIVFNKRMVELGDMEASAQGLPVSITPQPDCSWRWLNTTSLACWLDGELPLSTAYEVKIAAGMKALDGTVLEKDHVTRFATATLRAAGQQVEFTDSPVLPTVTVSFNQPVKQDSLEAAAAFKCNLFGSGVSATVRPLGEDEERGRFDASRSFYFTPQKDLGADDGCKLILDRGKMVAVSGPLPAQRDIEINFRTFPDFFVREFACGWRNKTTGGTRTESLDLKKCDPGDSVHLRFSVPTTNGQLADRITVTPHAGWLPGGYNSPEYLKDNPDNVAHGYSLSRPFGGEATYQIALDPAITDRFGRPLQGAKAFSFETTHFDPSLDLEHSTAVIEAKGPHQVGYTAVNVKNFRLNLMGSRDSKNLDYIGLDRNWSSRCDLEKADPRGLFEAHDVQTEAGWDIPAVNPLDFRLLKPDLPNGFLIGRADEVYDLDGKRVDVDHRGNPICPKTFQVQITDFGITGKMGYFNSGAWVHSLKDATPKQGVVVRVVDENGNTRAYAGTDANGFVSLPGLRELDPARNVGSYGDDTLFLVAETADDFSFVDSHRWTGGIRSWDFGVPSSRLTAKNNFRMNVVSDRPLYKAGDTVRLKIYARQWDHESLKLLDPAERILTVQVANFRGDPVLADTEMKLNEFSTGDLEFTLPANAAMGGYTVYVKNIHGHALVESEAFRVEEYRLPTFKVTVEKPGESFQVTDAIPVNGNAAYHFGGPVQGVRGTLNVSWQGQPFRPKAPALEKYTFASDTGYYQGSPYTVVNESLATDADGVFRSLVTLPTGRVNGHGTVTMEARFPDDSGREIAARTRTTVHPTNFYLGLHTKEWVFEPKQDMEVQVVAVSPEDKPVPGVSVDLILKKREYNTVRRRGAGNYFHYDTTTTDKEMARCTVTTARQAQSCPLAPNSAGYYMVQAEARDGRGRPVTTTIGRYVTGPEYIGWWRQDNDRIDLIPEKKEYVKGDTLRVLVKSPYEEARALISLERHGILHREERTLTGGAQVLEFPIDRDALVPGFYLSVVLLSGRTSEKIEDGVDLGKPSFKMGMIRVPVSDPSTRLAVTSGTASAEVEPGATVTGYVSVAGPGGRAVDAEVMVAVVDEAVLQLAGDYAAKYEVHDYFYELPPLDVTTSETLIHLIGRRHYGKKGADPGGGGGAGEERLRELFKAVAYWEPALRTGADGKAQFTFTAPDNLTTWRIIAVAVDTKHRFGTGTDGSFKVNQKLMLESALPNFATEGDAFDARFVVHNRVEGPLDVDVSLTPGPLKLAGPGEQPVTVPAGGKGIVQFPLTAPSHAGAGKVEIRARSGELFDGMRLPFKVVPFATPAVFATYGSTTTDGVTEGVQIPPGIRTDVGGIELLVSSSVLSHLNDVFRYVFEYPYLCWEQRLTKALMYRNAVALDGYLDPEVKVAKQAASGLIAQTMSDAARFQTPSGGFAYWSPRDELADPYLSAYTGLGMLWLEEARYPVPADVKTRLHGYLDNLLRNDSAWPWYYSKRSRASVRAMIGYTLLRNGRNTGSAMSNLYGDRELLSLFGKGFLWMGLNLAQNTGGMAESLAGEIRSHMEITSGKVQFQETNDDGWGRILHTTTRTNCLLLTAFTQVAGSEQQTTPLTRFITESRKAGRWNNTQENLYCTNALVDYARIYEKDTPDFTVSGSLGGHDIGSETFKGFDANPRTFSYPFAADDPGRQTELKLTRKGTGRAYYTARIRFAYQDVPGDPVNAGMTVAREYAVHRNGAWQPLADGGEIKRGEIVRVSLKVGIPAERLFVALSDPLAAGLEPINTALASASKALAQLGEGDNSSGGYSWNEDDLWYGAYRSGGFYHREMGLEAVRWFADFISPGTYEMAYVAQAIATGTFSANAPIVEEMYAPETYGAGVPARFVVAEP
ncbi:MAG: MG2 domain-containing protein [Nitrospirota bacterium]|nr:MG2 domain-containing protein [Nitrospirota bacterium]